MIHRNTGASFPRADGSVWGRGQEAEPTEAELRRRHYKLKPVVAAMRPRKKEELDEVASVAEGEWPLVMSPEKYLKLHPKGQHADLARMLDVPERLSAEEKPDDGSEDIER